MLSIWLCFGFGIAPLFGDRRGYTPPQLKTTEIWLFLTDFADFIRKRSGDNKTSFIAVDSCKSISKGNKTLNLSTTMIWIVHELKHNFPSIELHIETFYTGRIFLFHWCEFSFFTKTQGYLTNKNNEQLIKQKFLDHVWIFFLAAGLMT